MQLTKLEAGRRQLDVAIRLLFEGEDPIAVHTLVGAASTIISDLVEKHHPDESWDKFAQDANRITASEYFQVMRRAQNLLKHARADSGAVFHFDPTETDALAFWAAMNLGNFGPLSLHASVFQLWYLSCYAPILDRNIKPYKVALDVFGDMRSEVRAVCLAAGKRVLLEQLACAE